jgi:hypothetical protein
MTVFLLWFVSYVVMVDMIIDDGGRGVITLHSE